MLPCTQPCAACRYDFFARAETVIGQHAAGVRCVEWLPERGLLATRLLGRHAALLGPPHTQRGHSRPYHPVLHLLMLCFTSAGNEACTFTGLRATTLRSLQTQQLKYGEARCAAPSLWPVQLDEGCWGW